MFSKEEINKMSAAQVHDAFRAYCSGASVDEVRAAALGAEPIPAESQVNPALSFIHRRAEARTATTEAAKTALNRYFRQ